MVNIAVIFPSRGLAFSETCEELLDNLEGYKYEIYFAHGLNLPDCFNKPLERAMKKKHTHYWIVEDDMILPMFTLTKLLNADKPAVTFDYPVTKDGMGSVQRDSKGKVLFTGTGCLLLKDSFLRKFRKPIFYSNIRWDMHLTKEGVELKRRPDNSSTYGMHDVNFGLECYRRGTPITVLEGTLGQRKLVALGKPGSNQGQHQVEVWDKVTKHPELIKLSSKVTTSPLVAVKLKDGTTTNVTEETAKRLENASKGKRVKYGEVNFL